MMAPGAYLYVASSRFVSAAQLAACTSDFWTVGEASSELQ